MSKTLRDIDWDATGNLHVAISHQRGVALLMRDCDAETGRFRFADEMARIAVLKAADRLWDELDQLINRLAEG